MLPLGLRRAPVVTAEPTAAAVVAPEVLEGLRRDVHLLIATVPWRRSSVERLLREVAAQTMLPGHVHLLLDGHEQDQRPDHSCLGWDGLEVHVHHQRRPRGAGERWRVAERLRPSDIVVNVDDDIILPPRFVERHVVALEQYGGAIASGGDKPDGTPIMCVSKSRYEGPLVCAQAGALSLRAGLLQGLSQRPQAAQLLGLLGDDEGMVSAHLWKTGQSIRRIAEPVGFDPSAGDPRAQYNVGRTRIVPLRRRLVEELGWPWRMPVRGL